mgnify:FL=1|tara:strand:- start:136 stop:687 length:552 start_codon:yes stop_codon:yes gene_type:complete
MSCDVTAGRLINCRDIQGGIQAVYIINFGDMGAVTVTGDEVTDMAGTFQAFRFDVRGAGNSLEQAITASSDNGTVFFEQTLSLSLPKLSKEDMVQFKLLSFGRPHCVIVDNNGNALLAGKEFGLTVSGGSITTSDTMAGMSGTTLTLTGQEKLPANFISGATVANPFAGLSTPTVTIVEGTNS